ncbi:MAG: hypothetical protein J7501_01215 [Bdellovibrio sp.]|nr:hypothetical protein [Bdellovibrio sp.]
MKNLIYRMSVILLSSILTVGSSYAAQEATGTGTGSKQGASSNGDTQAPKTLGGCKSEDGPDCKDAAGVGLDAVYKEINTLFSQLKAVPNIKDGSMPRLTEAMTKYSENRQSCIDRQEIAAYSCLENYSPVIQDIVTGANTIASTLGDAVVNDSCSKFAKIMDLAKAGMTTYTGVCGAAKAGCGLSCVAARDAISSLNKALSANNNSIICPNPQLPCVRDQYQLLRKQMADKVRIELAEGDKASIAGKAKVCTEKYAQLLMSGVTGIASLAGAFKQGKSCEENTDAAGPKETATAEKCADAANAQLPECICLKNPMMEGCNNIATKATDNVSGGISALSSVGTGSDTASGLNSGDLMGGKEIADTPQREPSSNEPAGVGAPVGGGSAGLGGGGGGFGGAGHASGGDEKGKSLNTNILAGSGGGGGGGDWGTVGGSGSDKSGYRSFLPGGAKDPLKAAGAQNWTKEVTGQGGKSNFEKVKDRYNDNKNTLLNN